MQPKLTNLYGLPESFVNIVTRVLGKYDKGRADFSVTELVSPARICELKRAHKGEYTMDVSDYVYMVWGSLVHQALQEADDPNVLTEERVFMERAKVIISGQWDRLTQDGVLDDYKMCSHYAIADGLKDEWIAQLNLLAILARETGFTVNTIRAQCWLRDHSPAKAHRGEHPPHPIVIIEAPLWEQKQTEHYLRNRLQVHLHARDQGVDIIHCTDEERWARPDAWAVQKPKNKRASRVMPAEAEAIEWRNDQKKPADYDIVFRQGAQVRCADYCEVAQFCDQYTALKHAAELAAADADAA